jgi:aldose 1-epimerase
MTTHEIVNGESRMTFDSIGAYIKSINLSGAGILMETPDGEQTHGGAAMLIPFANRVRNAEYNWEGKEYHLPKNNGDHSIHGLTRDLDWTVLTEATKSILSTDIRHEGYPNGVKVKVEMIVKKNSFEISMDFMNSGDLPVPLSPGMHPYFRFQDRWQVKAFDQIRMLEYVDDYFPNGNMIKTDPDVLSSESGKTFDNCFSMGNKLKLLLGSHAMLIETRNMPYFVVYNGKYSAGKSVAVEPMVAPPDAFNNHIGLVTVEPGRSFSCGARFELSR